MKKKIWIALIGFFTVGILTIFAFRTGYIGAENHVRHSLFREQLMKHPLQGLSADALATLKGRPFLLHFWAKWCEPCTDEIPHLVKFAAAQKSFQILAVSLDENLEVSKKILPSHGEGLPANFILALDHDHTFAEGMGSYQYPETYLIDADGVILEKWVGPQKWNSPEVLGYFEKRFK